MLVRPAHARGLLVIEAGDGSEALCKCGRSGRPSIWFSPTSDADRQRRERGPTNKIFDATRMYATHRDKNRSSCRRLSVSVHGQHLTLHMPVIQPPLDDRPRLGENQIDGVRSCRHLHRRSEPSLPPISNSPRA